MPPETYNALNDADPRLAAVLRGEVWPTGFCREWSAPTDGVWVHAHAAGQLPLRLYLGRGDWISCGEAVPARHIAIRNRPSDSRLGFNVCRPFNEAHAYMHELDREWNRLHWCDSLTDGNGEPIAKAGETWNASRLNEFSRVVVPKSLRPWIQFSDPPNHGHGSPCTCLKLVATPRKAKWDDTHGMVVHLQGEALCVTAATKTEALSVAKQGAMKLRPGSHMLPVPDGLTLFVITRRHKRACHWCEGTGSVFCDQDGRGGRSRVSKKMRVAWAKWARANLGDDASADPLGYATPMLADSTV